LHTRSSHHAARKRADLQLRISQLGPSLAHPLDLLLAPLDLRDVCRTQSLQCRPGTLQFRRRLLVRRFCLRLSAIRDPIFIRCLSIKEINKK
jgi:hypothetical protein